VRTHVPVWAADTVAPSAARREGEFNRHDIDERAIRQLILAFNNARHALDAQAIAGLFTRDGEFTTPLGTGYRGRRAIQQFFTTAFADPEMRSSGSTREVKRIRFVRSDVALVEVSEELNTVSGVIRVLEIIILTKADRAWLIASLYHTHLITSTSSTRARRSIPAWVTGLALLRESDVRSASRTPGILLP